MLIFDGGAAPLAAFGATGFTIGQYGITALVQLGALVGVFYLTSILFIIGVLGTVAWASGFSIFRFIASRPTVPSTSIIASICVVNLSLSASSLARLFVVVPYDIPPRCTATYYPETNVLVPIGSVAEKSNTPTSKLVLISIRKRADS